MRRRRGPQPTRPSFRYGWATDLWETPPKFFGLPHEEFEIGLDVCAISPSAKCERFRSPQEDGISQPRAGTCWMNPPYVRTIRFFWVAMAFAESHRGATVACLLPARTDTAWWHKYLVRAPEIRFLRGRLKFGTAEHSAPFPSAVVVFRPGPEPETPRLLTMSVRRRGIPEFSVN